MFEFIEDAPIRIIVDSKPAILDSASLQPGKESQEVVPEEKSSSTEVDPVASSKSTAEHAGNELQQVSNDSAGGTMSHVTSGSPQTKSGSDMDSLPVCDGDDTRKPLVDSEGDTKSISDSVMTSRDGKASSKENRCCCHTPIDSPRESKKARKDAPGKPPPSVE
jgi:hypothetical protein